MTAFRFRFACIAVLAATGRSLLSAQDATTFRHRPATEIRAPGDSLTVTLAGRGPTAVVAVTGHSHGVEYYASLVERLGDRFTFHILVPPGMGGTAAYPWPADAEGLEGEEWTERFVADALAYVERTLPAQRPVLLAAWDTGIGQALRLAERAPDRWRSAVLVGATPYYRWYRALGAEAPDSFDLALQRTQRLPGTMRFWRTVAEPTWHQNTFPAAVYTADSALGVRLKAAERSRPFEIHLRYFAEYLWGDHLSPLRRLRIPVFAVAPRGALELAQGAWQQARNSCVRVVAAPSNRMMPWHDHPAEFDSVLVAAAASRDCGSR